MFIVSVTGETDVHKHNTEPSETFEPVCDVSISDSLVLTHTTVQKIAFKTGPVLLGKPIHSFSRYLTGKGCFNLNDHIGCSHPLK